MERTHRQTTTSIKEELFKISLWMGFFSVLAVDFLLNAFQLLSQSIRLDEAQSIWVAAKPVSAILPYVSKDVAAPLYLILLHFWIQFFGSNIAIDRLLSLLFFLLTLPVLYRMARESSNKAVGKLTVILFSFSPFIMWYTSEARMYTLFTFIASINNLYFLRFLHSTGKKGKAGLFISIVIGLYTHYFFAFLIVTQGVYLLMRLFLDSYKGQKGRIATVFFLFKRARALPLLFLKIVLIAFLFFTPWILYILFQGGNSNSQPLIPPPTSFNIFQTFINFLFGFQGNWLQAVIISLWPLGIILLFFAFTQKHHTMITNIGYFVLATFFPIILNFSLSYIRPIFLPRYLIFVTPTLFFILAWLLINNSRKVSSFLISTVLIIMFGLMLYQNISSLTPVKEDYRGVSDYLEKNARPGDLIAVSAPFTIYPLEYTYNGSAKIDTIPIWDRYSNGPIPQFTEEELEKQIKKYTTQYQHLFVVFSYDQGYQKKVTAFLDTHYKRDSYVKFSPGLEVREYQLQYN
jgi:uncharacterized membrane protein